MKINLPVTDHERRFPESQKLISTTDLKGRITYVNDAFIDISGYTREELIGKAHNIIRHPDMPPAAFAILWEHVKAGNPWMGLVKNRAKDGSFYWVNAYVTPITDNGQVVGYESVRVCPERRDVERAEKLYARINKGKKRLVRPEIPWSLVAMVLATVVAAGAAFGGQHLVAEALLAVVGIGAVIGQRLAGNRLLGSIEKLLGHAFNHPVAVASYTDDSGMAGRIKVAVLSEIAHLNTVLTRIEDAAHNVSLQAEEGLQMSEQSRNAMRGQQAETETVAAAMYEMTATINDVAKHVQETASNVDESNVLAQKGQEVSQVTRQSIQQLSDTVEGISNSVTELSGQTGRIAQAAVMIEQIAEQTNLLALNAAIEAARAGEQGRGFAVVADEVRQLAQRTQKSTGDIHEIVRQLTDSAKRSVDIAAEGKREAQIGVERVTEVEEMLRGISAAMNNVAGMSVQMATAVEEQAHVSEDISRQVSNISTLATDSLAKAEDSSESIKNLQTVSGGMHELVVGFKR